MEEIVPVSTTTIEGAGKLTCDGRALHTFLEVGRDFSTWIKERIAKYGFMEGVDFVTLPNSGERDPAAWGGQNKIGYALTLDMAKELAMVENNDRGRQVRSYFIACERRAREVHAASQQKPTLRQQAEQYLQQVIEMERIEAEQAEQAKRLERVESVAVAALAKAESNYGHYTVLGWSKINGLSFTLTEAAQHGRKLTEICTNLGIYVEKVRDPRFGLVNTYPEKILEDYFNF